MKKILFKIYNSHITLILSMCLGIYVGISHKDIATALADIGELYLRTLTISIIPIVIFSLLLAAYYIKTTPLALIARTAFTAICVVTIGLAVVVSLTLFIAPWSYVTDITSFNSLFAESSLLSNIVMDVNDKFIEDNHGAIIGLLLRAIPSNLVNMLNTGNMLQIVLGSFIVSYGLFVIAERTDKTDQVKQALEFGLDVFTKINDLFISFMPIGVFFLMLSQFLSIDFRALFTLGMLTAVITGSIIIQIIVYIFIIKLRSGKTLGTVLSVFSETFMLVFTTRSSIVAMPKAMEAMTNLKFSQSVTDVYLPFGISLVRLGTMSFFAIVTLFIMGIFDVDINFASSLFIVFACIVAATSTIGTTGIISLQMIAIVLDPLGLPLGGVIAILIVVDAVVDIFDTFANVVGNCAIAALVDRRN